MEEVYHVDSLNLVNWSDGAFHLQTLLQSEIEMLKVLEYKHLHGTVTVAQFAMYYAFSCNIPLTFLPPKPGVSSLSVSNKEKTFDEVGNDSNFYFPNGVTQPIGKNEAICMMEMFCDTCLFFGIDKVIKKKANDEIENISSIISPMIKKDFYRDDNIDELYSFAPSKLAAACIYLTKRILNIQDGDEDVDHYYPLTKDYLDDPWWSSEKSVSITSYTLSDLLDPCAAILKTIKCFQEQHEQSKLKQSFDYDTLISVPRYYRDGKRKCNVFDTCTRWMSLETCTSKVSSTESRDCGSFKDFQEMISKHNQAQMSIRGLFTPDTNIQNQRSTASSHQSTVRSKPAKLLKENSSKRRVSSRVSQENIDFMALY
jgi:Cyclin, C-terminal domain